MRKKEQQNQLSEDYEEGKVELDEYSGTHLKCEIYNTFATFTGTEKDQLLKELATIAGAAIRGVDGAIEPTYARILQTLKE